MRLLVCAVAALVFAPAALAHTDSPAQLAFAWPAQGAVTSPFGNDNGRWHPGIDIGILRSLDVTAAAPGAAVEPGARAPPPGPRALAAAVPAARHAPRAPALPARTPLPPPAPVDRSPGLRTAVTH